MTVSAARWVLTTLAVVGVSLLAGRMPAQRRRRVHGCVMAAATAAVATGLPVVGPLSAILMPLFAHLFFTGRRLHPFGWWTGAGVAVSLTVAASLGLHDTPLFFLFAATAAVGLASAVGIRLGPRRLVGVLIGTSLVLAAISPAAGLCLGPIAAILFRAPVLFAAALEAGSVSAHADHGEAAEVLRARREARAQEDLVAVGFIAAGVIHELKNVLASVAVAAGYGIEHGEEADRSLALIAESAAGGLREATGSLGGIAELHPADPESVAVADTARESVRAALAGARRRAVRVRMDVPEDLAAFLPRRELQQVLTVLLRNALAAFAAITTGDVAEREIRVVGRATGGDVTVSVGDDAGGLPLEYRRWAGEEETGGLGLFLASRILERRGGHLEQCSRPGGITFRVILPSRPFPIRDGLL